MRIWTSKAILMFMLTAGLLSEVLGIAQAQTCSWTFLKPEDRFISIYLRRVFASPEENQAWIDKANSGLPGTFFDIENSVLKFLNDHTSSKNLVTSLNHFHKEIFLKGLNDLVVRNSGLRVLKYSDYKSVRLAFEGVLPENLYEQLQLLFERTNLEFAQAILEKNLIASSLDPVSWFKAGIGSSADQANLAARYSRHSKERRIFDFSDPSVTEHLSNVFHEAEQIRKELEDELGPTPLMESVPNSDKKVISAEALDLIRKNKDLVILQRALWNVYSQPLSQEQIERLWKYFELVDQFSPGIRIVKREVVSLSGHSGAGFTIDFTGLGAKNLNGTAQALALATDLKSAVQMARVLERKVTAEFEKKKADLKRLVINYLGDKRKSLFETKCSGDDCVVLLIAGLDEKSKREVVQRVSRSFSPEAFRLSFVPKDVDRDIERNQIATHGEQIEKLLRINLRGLIHRDVLRQLTLAIDMNTRDVGQGSATLLVGNSTQPLNSKQLQILKSAFQKAVSDFNRVLTEAGETGNYQTSKHPQADLDRSS